MNARAVAAAFFASLAACAHAQVSGADIAPFSCAKPGETVTAWFGDFAPGARH